MKNFFGTYVKAAKYDIPSSIVVFLVALPLCLGIALASGAPLFAGLISGIVGGIVIGLLSKSSLSVSGPAAGLVVIVLNAVDSLGSYEAFLMAVVLAGVIQLALGFLKAGIIGLYFPSSVIKGMLAAIGLILILKQFPYLIGFTADAFGDMKFLQSDGSNTFSDFFAAFTHMEVGSLIIGLFSLFLMIFWDRPIIKNNGLLKRIPAGVLVVVMAIVLNQVFGLIAPNLAIDPVHLVSLPIISEMDSIQEVFTAPNFGVLGNPTVYVTAFTLAIVASLETLLSVEAIDKLDPLKRRTPQNAELKAQGVGNIVSGLIGGLPITAVIVRSSANLDSGARTKMSAVYHGILLLVAVAVFPMVMNMIPLSALAAILIMVGFKLTKPSLYKAQYLLGKDRFIPFFVTVVCILFTDLLVGILIGMSVGIFYVLRANYKVPYFFKEEKEEKESKPLIRIELSEHVSFLNKASLQLTFEHLPENREVLIDGSSTKEIDYDALEVIYNFKNTAHEKNIVCHFKNIPEFGKNGEIIQKPKLEVPHKKLVGNFKKSA
ncbi:Sulfate permease, MFS superfamily [Zhouia amylolytica]|uniref:Sulfate permease, MFS superfamily n=1 Tax=Zhouia amylolytica TaxID=376730 RepID=A0A1I6TTC5_9FLAO|nr:SulP family inorganic anion transporter [Zhouia amylolytica]MCQ0110192.1 SulP family inorganic anion transporter [Zhouia amylolytica]SFS92499.1 Sulfate permease, MFS superfamily [Zhouia amylolytica]